MVSKRSRMACRMSFRMSFRTSFRMSFARCSGIAFAMSSIIFAVRNRHRTGISS